MSTVTQAFCDRCQALIRESRLLLRLETGRLRQRLPQVDLCGPCTEAFSAWLASAPVPAPAVPEPETREEVTA